MVDEDFDESQQKTGQGRAQDRSAAPRMAATNDFQPKQNAHVGVEHRVGHAEKDAGGRGQGRADGKGQGPR